MSLGTSRYTALISWAAIWWILAPPTLAAEFRTSVRGQTVVRPTNFQETVEDLAPADMLMQEEPLMVGEGFSLSDGYDPSCYGTCAPACRPCWTYWGSFEFLLWWRKGQDLPPLVTTSPADTPAESAGVLGFPDTDILYATEEQANDARPGGRLTLGIWLDPCMYHAVGTRLYSLGESTANFDRSSDEVSILARPFYNASLEQEDAALIAYPGFTTGSISVRNTSRVGGGDVFYRRMFFQSGHRRLDLVAGYQFSRIDTTLGISSGLESISSEGSIPLGTVVEVSDVFDTRNTYHAGEIGLWGVWGEGPLTWSLLAKVGLGNMQQRTEIAGQSFTHVPGLLPVTTNQGLLSLNTNRGVYERDTFAVSPELALMGSYRLTERIALSFGYSFIFWNHVVQPDSQIDRVINPTQITGQLVGPARPAFLDNDDSYYVHGVNFGVQWVW